MRPPSVEDALTIILRATERGAAEDVRLPEAAGRVLAARIVATEDLWPFARAAMDGIALRGADVAGASTEHPARLLVTGAVYAGQAADGALRQGSACAWRPGAGAARCDAVIPQELLQIDGNACCLAPIAPGQHLSAGEDVRAASCPRTRRRAAWRSWVCWLDGLRERAGRPPSCGGDLDLWR
jgi:molybdopterin biosynthesis enzyme